MFKGFKYGAFLRSFVDFSLDNPFARHFYDWIYPTKSPDEGWQPTLATLTMKPALELAEQHRWKIWQRFDEGFARNYNHSDDTW